jgi:hypothetical protein
MSPPSFLITNSYVFFAVSEVNAKLWSLCLYVHPSAWTFKLHHGNRLNLERDVQSDVVTISNVRFLTEQTSWGANVSDFCWGMPGSNHGRNIRLSWDNFHVFPQYLHSNPGITPWNKIRLFCSTSFSIHHSLVILQFDAVQSELLGARLHYFHK